MRLGEMSSAAMGMPVLCAVVLDDKGLGTLSACLMDYRSKLHRIPVWTDCLGKVILTWSFAGRSGGSLL